MVHGRISDPGESGVFGKQEPFVKSQSHHGANTAKPAERQ